ncbi:MAG: type II toxin-antitoxin system VapC family toxin [Candidatus Dormibacteria bacterium]
MIFDTGPIVAALNEQDRDHRRCAELLQATADLLIPAPVLVELDYWLVKLGGPTVWRDFVDDLVGGAYRVVDLTEEDIQRAAELELTYSDLGLGFVDASVIALSERLAIRDVATLDRRHVSVVRPRHCPHLTLHPD